LQILITGGNGFIAKHLFEQLTNEYSVISMNRKQLNLLDSISVLNYIKSNHFDVIIHTATYDAAAKYSLKDPSHVLENNLKMFYNITRCKDHFGKMIYFGSGAEFGRDHWIPQMKESYFDQYVPSDQYGFSKYVMAKYAQQSNNIYNLRLFGVFGKYDDYQTRFIANACCRAVVDMPIRMNRNRRFDHIYIDDLINIVKWFVNNKPQYNVYNVCTGIAYDFVTLAEKIIAISGKDLDIIIESEDLGNEYSGDNSMLMNEINPYEFEPIDNRLMVLYAWYETNKNIIDKSTL
jgi:UDP-glucose 4-epimerase